MAKEFKPISNDKMDLIRHCRKSLLFHNDELWIKKGDKDNFDNPMGAYDGAEVCELVGCLLLNNLNSYVDPKTMVCTGTMDEL